MLFAKSLIVMVTVSGTPSALVVLDPKLEVYPSLAKATNSANKIATSQMALPEATAKAVYATTGYERSRQQSQPREPWQ